MPAWGEKAGGRTRPVRQLRHGQRDRRQHHRPDKLGPMARYVEDTLTLRRCTSVHIIGLFRGFEWDEDKARDNLRKHGLDFADATAVLEDEWALTPSDV